MSLTPLLITGFNLGLVTNKKPFLLPDEAFPSLNNAYMWRDRVKKREGLQFLGRLRRGLTTVAMGNISAAGAGTFTFNIFMGLAFAGLAETNAQIEEGSITPITIAIGAPINQTLTDTTGTGIMTIAPAGVITAALINYSTGELILTFSGAEAASAATFTGGYYPGFPVMGIWQRDRADINDEQTVWWDQKYAYIWNGAEFVEFLPASATTWKASNSDFFWTANYRGADAFTRLFFATDFLMDFVNARFDPIRYTDGVNPWVDFAPLLTDPPQSAISTTLFQARLIVPYFGRLLFFNTWEGVTGAGYAGAKNYYNRVRFSQEGDPVDPNESYRTDIYGKGGFLDAPTNEAIIGAIFVKNTLIVFFERTTWQLRYVGDYGIPFIWERTSSDFGSESTFSSVLFDNSALAVGDKAIITANSINSNRIDLQIPDQIFNFKNANEGVKRVWGIRDYDRELVFWNYPDSQTKAAPGVDLIFPNKVLVYNYRNGSFAIFRDSVTAFGTFQNPANVNWDSLRIKWDDEGIFWDDPDTQSLFPSIVSGNQEGYVHFYGYTTPDQQSLSIRAINVTVSPIRLTVIDHNLQDLEIIFLGSMIFVNNLNQSLTSTLNESIYQVGVIDKDTITIKKWNEDSKTFVTDFDFSFTPTTALSDVRYLGGGEIALYPKLDIETKDINIFQAKGLQMKMAYLDFLMKATPSAAMTVNISINSSPSISGNMAVGNKEMSTALTSPFYGKASDYAWFRFYATCTGQYLRIQVTYDDELMVDEDTHNQSWEMYAIQGWFRPGGKVIF